MESRPEEPLFRSHASITGSDDKESEPEDTLEEAEATFAKDALIEEEAIKPYLLFELSQRVADYIVLVNQRTVTKKASLSLEYTI
jgi:hypothetical protein